MRRVAVLQVGIGENDEEGQRRIRTFPRQLKELGWADGHNVTIDFRWAGADADRMRTYVTELLALKPDVMLLNGGLVLSFVLQQTRTVPIVFTNTSDPVGSGFVASLAHPDGNVTGFAGAEFSVFGKLLATLKNNDHDVAHGPRRQGLVLADGN